MDNRQVKHDGTSEALETMDEVPPIGRKSLGERSFTDIVGLGSGMGLARRSDMHSATSLRSVSRGVCIDEEVRSETPSDEIVGTSVALRRVLGQAEIVAPTDSIVLIQGETGTGKELIARAIHDLSSRRDRPFIKLNCAAIPSGLLESELFGHDRGAFTGAIGQKIGRFEVAHGGTLFLDEIGEIPLELQPKLLRILQEQEFERLGGTRTIKVDVRLVAATNRDLARMVEAQRFRDDLYYRVNVFPIYLPPLRERPEDIPALVHHFARRFARRMNRRIEVIPQEALEAMHRYRWPGNIRQLANLIERAMILSPGPSLDIPFAALEPAQAPTAHQNGATTLAGLERAHILGVLEEANWLIAGPRGAAARLGMKRTTLQSLIKRLGIIRPAAAYGPQQSPADATSPLPEISAREPRTCRGSTTDTP